MGLVASISSGRMGVGWVKLRANRDQSGGWLPWFPAFWAVNLNKTGALELLHQHNCTGNIVGGN